MSAKLDLDSDRDADGVSDTDPDTPAVYEDIPDGCGCVELWERLSEARERVRDRKREEAETGM